MVVDVNAPPQQVAAYVKAEAARGLEHARALVKGEGDAIIELIAGLGESDAAFSPAPGEFSTAQVIQHLNGSFERSLDRLRTLIAGRPFVYDGPRIGPGSLPAEPPATFAETRDAFVKGMADVLALLGAADPAVGLDVTSDHVNYGPFNWLQWAVYSHHVHSHDHVLQLGAIKAALQERRERLERLKARIREIARLPAPELKQRLSREAATILALTEGLSEADAAFAPAEGEWSVSQVMQHLVGSYQRNRVRIAALVAGRTYEGPPTVPGTLPDRPLGSLAAVRAIFSDARDTILDLLDRADPDASLDLTTDHSAFGSLNWREWCAFTLEFHTSDHRAQIEQIKAALAGSRR